MPVELEDDFRPSEDDMKYAENFRMIARAIDECEKAELVALLLSTCRNQWMAVNGMFVDLQGILGADRLPDLASRAYHHFAEGEPAPAAKLFKEALRLRAALAQKLDCWSARAELREQLEAAISSPEKDPLERDRLEGWLERQGHGPYVEGRSRQAQYLRLDASDAHCQQELELIERSAAKLTGALRISHRVAHLLALAEALAVDKARTVEEPDPLFDLEDEAQREAEDEQDRQAEAERKLGGAWGRLRTAVLRHGADLGFAVEGSDEEAIELEGPDGAHFQLELEIAEDDPEVLIEDTPAVLEELVSRSRTVTDIVRSQVFEAFKPNVLAPPMPAPFVIDLTPDDTEPSEARVRPFTVHVLNGRQSTPNTARLALLNCGMPGSAYLTARKGHIVYDPNHKEGARQAKQIALAAVAEASRCEAAFLALPEVFLPRSAASEVVRAAEEANVGLIAGLEYPEKHGGPINEVLIHVPGWDEPQYQRKQGPSVEEINHVAFESTQELFFIRNTKLGNVGVIVCSDVMELDLVWALSSFDYKLDLVVICARNYRPEVFERIAVADAIRLHALIAVVNSWAPRARDGELPSGKGTGVAQPNSVDPFLPLTEHELPVAWEGKIEQPKIAIAELNIAEIRARDLERPGAHGYITPPRFARL